MNILLNEGANFLATDNQQNTALHFAVKDYKRKGFLVTDKPLIYECFSIYSHSQPGVTSEAIAIITSLILKGGDINAVGEDRKSPLHVASEYGSPEVLDLLALHGVNINAKSADLRTALHSAASSGSALKIRTILDMNPDVTQKDRNGDTAFHILKRQPKIDCGLATRFLEEGK